MTSYWSFKFSKIYLDILKVLTFEFKIINATFSVLKLVLLAYILYLNYLEKMTLLNT